MSCLICEQISPTYTGTRYTIHEGKYWVLEHTALPTTIKGWLRLVAKRHVEALHELTPKEFSELSKLLRVASGVLHKQLHTDKEYIMSFGEGSGVRHLHVHLVNKQADLPEEFRAAKIFGLLNVPPEKGLSATELTEFCKKFKRSFVSALKKL